MRSVRFLLLPAAAPAAAEESDPLACVEVKDSPQVDGPIPVAISNIGSDALGECRVGTPVDLPVQPA